jgi:hypothetical protein
MSDELALRTTVPLPAPPVGWFDYGYALLWNGNLALIRMDRDVHTELARWHVQVQGENLLAPHPDLRDTRLRLSKFDGAIEIGAIEVPAGRWPKVDCFPDGRWLVASGRAAPDEINARLFAADGTPVGAFAVGDGIEHIRCAPDGTVWVGYFDEGVFSGPAKDGGWPVSSSGIARFGADGGVLWRFNGEERADLFIADCYAMTLEGNTLWCCPYTDFPIVRVKDGALDRWANDVAGAKAIAADGDYVLLAGGYTDNSGRIAILRLGSDRAQLAGEWHSQLLKRNGAHLLQGQGATLHIVGQAGWTKLSLAAIRATLRM